MKVGEKFGKKQGFVLLWEVFIRLHGYNPFTCMSIIDTSMILYTLYVGFNPMSHFNHIELDNYAEWVVELEIFYLFLICNRSFTAHIAYPPQSVIDNINNVHSTETFERAEK